MPPVLTAASVITCPHAAPVAHTPSQVRVTMSGAPALTLPDVSVITGCLFNIPSLPKPSPCVTIQWTVAATRVFAGGAPVLLQSSVGVCKSPEQAPQGPPIISVVQPRVQGM